MSLVRLVLVICLQETNDPTLDFVRLSLFGYVSSSARVNLVWRFGHVSITNAEKHD